MASYDDTHSKLWDETINLIQAAKFDSSNWRDLAPILLSCAIFESIDSVCILGKEGKKLQAELIFRSALEQYAALVLVCKSPIWINGMLVRECNDWIKTFERAKNGNPFFKSLSENYDLDELIKKSRAEITEYEADGAKWGRIADRFDAAGLKTEYEGLYHKLCDSAHSNLNALKNRYLEIANDKLEVVLRDGAPAEADDPLQLSTAQLLEFFQEQISGRFLNKKWKFEDSA